MCGSVSTGSGKEKAKKKCYNASSAEANEQKMARVVRLSFALPDGDSRMNRKAKTKVGRNDPCPCGSGKKSKKCCANHSLPPSNALIPDAQKPRLIYGRRLESTVPQEILEELRQSELAQQE